MKPDQVWRTEGNHVGESRRSNPWARPGCWCSAGSPRGRSLVGGLPAPSPRGPSHFSLAGLLSCRFGCVPCVRAGSCPVFTQVPAAPSHCGSRWRAAGQGESLGHSRIGLTVLGMAHLLTSQRNLKPTVFLSLELGIKRNCGIPSRHSDMCWFIFMEQRITNILS